MNTNELIMDLTQEQGGGRESQIQPPIEVWEQFFGFRPDSGSRPTYRLENQKQPSDPEQRKVVKHHHNFTLEVGDAKLPRPAIIRVRRSGHNSFLYWVYRAKSIEFKHCDWLLENIGEKSRDRRWLII